MAWRGTNLFRQKFAVCPAVMSAPLFPGSEVRRDPI